MNAFRQPAEWAPHAATWVAWPSAGDLWGDNLGRAQESFALMCVALADVDPFTRARRGEALQILVADADAEATARPALESTGATFHRVPFGDIWLRDTAPLFGFSGGEVASARFGFNGWGGKYVLDHDDGVAARVADLAGRPTAVHPFVLEGGSVEVDGQGTVLATRQCLLNPNRNPTLDAVAIETLVLHALGGTKMLWLDDGLLNDHTDGHVDTVARFVAPGVVVCMEATTADDPNAGVMDEIARALASMTDAAGRRLRVVRIPSPGRVVAADGAVMPASYVNFYVGNTSVVVPTYGSPADADAVRALARLFPGRRTVGIDARAILSGGGAFHCITQQEPRGTP